MHHRNDGRSKRTGRSERLARNGAIMVWSSTAVMLLFFAVFFSYGIANSNKITEDDFSFLELSQYEARMEVLDMTILQAEIESKNDDVKIHITITNLEMEELDSIKGTTPLVFQRTLDQAGEYLIIIEIEEGTGSFDELEIKIETTSFDFVSLCCGFCFGFLLILGLLITGFVYLMAALSRRRRELKYPRQRKRNASKYRSYDHRSRRNKDEEVERW
jgi:hypothetical protein